MVVGRASRAGAVLRGSRVGPALLAIAACAACSKKPPQRRTSDEAPVEVVTAPALPDGGVRGGTSDEIEPNDGDDVATPLAIGASVHGKIDPDTDVDHYRITVERAGTIAVIVDGHDQLDVVLEIEDGAGTVIARSDRGAQRIREAVPNLSVAPGRYTAVVQARKLAAPKKRPGKRAAPVPVGPVGGAYEITANLVTPEAGAEHEPDDDRGQANDLILGDTGTGYIGWSADLDVWKVSIEALSARNALELELSAVEGVALSAEISDGVGRVVAARRGPRGGPLVVRGFVPALTPGAPPFHYVTVKADRSNPETAYQLRVAAKVIAPDGELEPNDSPATAMAMPGDRKSLRAHWSAGDVDCFAVAAQDLPRALDVSLDTPNEVDLALDVLVEGAPAAKVDHPGKGAAEKVAVQVAAGAAAVVCVRGADSPGEAAYELAIDEGAASP